MCKNLFIPFIKNSPRSFYNDFHSFVHRDGGFAEELFISLENPDASAYAAIIQGMVKYYQVDRSLELFNEAQSKGIILSIDTFAAIIRVSNFIKEGYEQRWDFIVDILNRAKMAELRPNLNLLNSILKVLSTMGISQHTKQHCLATIREFKDLGIEPSLGSWYYVLITFCKERK